MNGKKVLKVIKYILIILSIGLTIASGTLISINFNEIKQLLNNNEALTWGFLSTICISIFSFINITFGIFIKIRQSITLKKQRIINYRVDILTKNLNAIITDNSISHGLRIKKITEILEMIKKIEVNDV